MLIVDATVPPIEPGQRVLHFARHGASAAALLKVGGGMMDIGWADRAAPSLAAVVDAQLPAVDPARFAAAVSAELTDFERRRQGLCNVGFVVVIRRGAGWRVARLGGARVYAVSPAGVRVVGTEDVLALPVTGALIETAALVSAVRWSVVDAGPLQLTDQADVAREQLAAVRVDDVVDATHLVVVGFPGWTSLREEDVVASSAAVAAQAGGAAVVVVSSA